MLYVICMQVHVLKTYHESIEKNAFGKKNVCYITRDFYSEELLL